MTTQGPTAEEWLRDIAANGTMMPVWLREGTRTDPNDSDRGDLDPADIAEVLALLDQARADGERWRGNMHVLDDALSHARTVHKYRCDCAYVTRTEMVIDFSEPVA